MLLEYLKLTQLEIVILILAIIAWHYLFLKFYKKRHIFSPDFKKRTNSVVNFIIYLFKKLVYQIIIRVIKYNYL